MSSLEIPRTTYVVSFLLFATAIGHVLVSGEAKSHIRNLIYGPPYAWPPHGLAKANDLKSTKAATATLAHLIESKAKDHHPTELPALEQTDRNRLQTLHSIRYNKTNYTWSHNFDILMQTGHKWCSILRDNHACFGDNYAAILNITTPYQGHRYNLLSFEAKHERNPAVGNSHLLELLYLPICATPSIFGYHFGFNTFLFQAASAEGLTRFASARQTTLLILDNDQAFAERGARPRKTIKFLEEINFNPTIIILYPDPSSGALLHPSCANNEIPNFDRLFSKPHGKHNIIIFKIFYQLKSHPQRSTFSTWYRVG